MLQCQAAQYQPGMMLSPGHLPSWDPPLPDEPSPALSFLLLPPKHLLEPFPAQGLQDSLPEHVQLWPLYPWQGGIVVGAGHRASASWFSTLSPFRSTCTFLCSQHHALISCPPKSLLAALVPTASAPSLLPPARSVCPCLEDREPAVRPGGPQTVPGLLPPGSYSW